MPTRSRRRGVALASLVLILLVGPACAPLNQRPAVAVGELDAFRESSDAIGIRFSLVDDDGRFTTADGKVQISVFQVAEHWSPLAGRAFERREQLHLLVFDVARSDFVRVRVGSGKERRDTIVYNAGTVPYGEFNTPPSASKGVVELVFHTPDARALQASDTLTF